MCEYNPAFAPGGPHNARAWTYTWHTQSASIVGLWLGVLGLCILAGCCASLTLHHLHLCLTSWGIGSGSEGWQQETSGGIENMAKKRLTGAESKLQKRVQGIVNHHRNRRD